MKELTNTEIAHVSGAGIISDFAKSIGVAIGSIVDNALKDRGLQSSAEESAGLLASGIGRILELNVFGAISEMGAGIVGIVNNSIDVIRQHKGQAEA
ncbi:hypothetical protein ACFSFZ_20785 [Mixta tenebrionis]|uniref:Uncharacterized protein n=1 Tax=Mixta tenebrionis TaxID=2562439 RepID=A0A506V5R0_9GAMM|nr:hypothetical protein [Mixta tenebrionis]TPW41008.1 hypothetical protein FKM52_16065 [Mixta tenebrionis]